MTPDEISAAVEKVRQWAEDARHLWDRNDDFTLRLHVWSNAKLSDAQIEDLINKAHGDRRPDTVLSLLLASRFLKKDASPLEIWAYSIFEERAMRRKPARKPPTPVMFGAMRLFPKQLTVCWQSIQGWMNTETRHNAINPRRQRRVPLSNSDLRCQAST